MKAHHSILVLALCAAACALAMACAQAPRGLLAVAPSPPPDIRAACELANKRCSHCHPIERVIVTRGIGPRRWQMYVEQMRLKPSSGISVEDGQTILRCLRYVEESCTDCKQGSS